MRILFFKFVPLKLFSQLYVMLRIFLFIIIYRVTQSRTQQRFVGWSPCRRVTMYGRLRHASPSTVVSGESAQPDH